MKLSNLYSDVIAVIESSIGDIPSIELIWQKIDQYKEMIFSQHEKVLAIYVSKYTRTPRANTITIFQKDDFY